MAHSGKTMTFATDIVPQEDNIYSLGTDDLKWIIRGSLPLSDITGADDLKAIEAISGTTGLLKKTAANTWTLDTNSYSLTSHNHNSTYLKLDGSNNMIADVNIIAGDTDKFVNFWYNTNKTAGASWRTGMLGSGSGNTNYFVIQSGTSTTSATTWHNALKIGQNNYDIYNNENRIPHTGNTTGSVGGTTTPVYVDAGQIKALSYTIAKSVPSDAVFTDHYAWSDITGKPTKITLTGAVTGNVSLGSGELSLATTVNHNHDSDYVNVTGDTMTGDLVLSNTSSGDSPALRFVRNSTNTDWRIKVSSGQLQFASATNDSSYTTRAYFKDQSGDLVLNSIQFGNNTSNYINDSFYTGKSRFSYHASAAHASINTSGSGWLKVKIKKKASWMLTFTIRLYTSYAYYDYAISGYNYGGNHWYSPTAVLLGSNNTDNRIVKFGYDDDAENNYCTLWVAVQAGNYYGIDIFNVTNGHSQYISDIENMFEIIHEDELTGTQQGNDKTIYRPWYRNETVSNATNATSATTAGAFSSGTTVKLTGDVTGESSSSTKGWSVATTIGSGKVTNAMLAGSIANAKLANSKITIAGNQVSLGESLSDSTLRESLGLSNALHFIGITSTELSNGSTTATLTPKISSPSSLIKTTGFVDGDVVMDGDQLREYVWSGSAWRLLGITTSTAYTQPASTATNTWIAQVSQGTDGKITATTGSLNTNGTWSGTAGTANKLAASKTIWGQTFDGSANVTGNLIGVGNQIKLLLGQTELQFLTSAGGAANGKFGKLGLNTTYANVDFTNYILDVNGKARIGALDGGQHVINGNVQLNSQSGSYNEGLRINRSTTGYANIYLGGTRSSASGPQTGGWWIGTLSTPADATSNGDTITNTVFTISNNNTADTLSIRGTRGATIGTNSGWAIRPRLAVGTTYNTSYNLYVNGTSYLNGNTIINGTTTSYGPLRIGNADAAANTGYATANSGSTNYITFYGVNGDGPGSYNHTYIGESIYGPKDTANEKSELLLFKGNDVNGTSGPDRIRLFANEIDIQVYTSTLYGTWDTIRATTGTQVANFKSGQVTINGNVTATTFTGNLTGNVTGNVSGSAGSVAWANTGHPDTFPPTIGNTATTAMAGNTTVTNVAISADTTTNKNYALVFGTTPSDGTSPTAAKTEGLQKNSAKFYVNPSTGNVQATTFNGYTLAAASAKGVVTTVDTSANLPTSNAVKTFVEGKGYVTSSGVTSVATGVGLTGGTITGTGTIKAYLKSETKATYDSATVTNTSSRQYAVTPDKTGYLSVNVPWADTHRVIKVNGTQALASNTTALNLIAGSNVSITDGGSGSVTIAATDTKYNAATTSTAGLMSAADKTKLNGIDIRYTENSTAPSNPITGTIWLQKKPSSSANGGNMPNAMFQTVSITIPYNTSTYTYSNSWITNETAIVATNLAQIGFRDTYITWTIQTGQIVFSLGSAISRNITFQVAMIK